MPALPKQSFSIPTPWIAILAQAFTPAFGLLNAVDIFYFGLKLSSVLAYASSLITASLLTLVFSMYSPLPVKRSIFIALAASLAIAFGSLVGMLTLHTGIAVEAHTGALSDDYFSYILVGSLSGLLIGVGCETLFVNLIKSGLTRWVSIIPSLTIAVVVVASDVVSVLQKFQVSLILTVLGLVIQIAIKWGYSSPLLRK